MSHEIRVALDISTIEYMVDQIRAGDLEIDEVAYTDDDGLHATVSPWPDGANRRIDLTIGMAEIHRSGLVFPMAWKARGGGGLFPELRGELRLNHVGRDRTQLVFQGNYEPPLGPLGVVADRVALGRLADLTVQNWLEALGEGLVTATSSI